jgi:uncharacterized protein (TIGR03435 family)
MRKYVSCTAIALASIIFGIANTPAVRAHDQSPAQSGAAANLKFEVASVKAAIQNPTAAASVGGRVGGGGGLTTCPDAFRMDRSRVDIECASLRTLIAYAFHSYPARVTGPEWMVGPGSPKFNIAAKLPEGAPENQIPEMVQALLADRFNLATHRAATEQEIYALVVAKGGLKVKQAGLSVPRMPTEPDAPARSLSE